MTDEYFPPQFTPEQVVRDNLLRSARLICELVKLPGTVHGQLDGEQYTIAAMGSVEPALDGIPAVEVWISNPPKVDYRKEATVWALPAAVPRVETSRSVTLPDGELITPFADQAHIAKILASAAAQREIRDAAIAKKRRRP